MNPSGNPQSREGRVARTLNADANWRALHAGFACGAFDSARKMPLSLLCPTWACAIFILYKRGAAVCQTVLNHAFNKSGITLQARVRLGSALRVVSATMPLRKRE